MGVGDGPAAFNTELTKKGGNIISVDPVYEFDKEQIRQRIDDLFDDMVLQVAANAKNLRLDKLGSAEALGKVRLQAMHQFLEDFEEGKKQRRYVNAQLPVLPFSNNQFDLALCSHLLFLYSEQLGLEFHVEAIVELCRIAKEVRIFPLLDLSHQLSTHLRPVMRALEQKGYTASIEKVDYEFQIGANQMLRIQSVT